MNAPLSRKRSEMRGTDVGLPLLIFGAALAIVATGAWIREREQDEKLRRQTFDRLARR